MVTRLSFTIPEDVATMLKARVSRRNRSAFVTAAVRGKLRELGRERLREALVEGYLARRDEDSRLSAEWEAASLENWHEVNTA